MTKQFLGNTRQKMAEIAKVALIKFYGHIFEFFERELTFPDTKVYCNLSNGLTANSVSNGAGLLQACN